MDALALLCTLYGDGPATLERLRSAGCASLEGLEELEPGELARILGMDPPAAERFLRESRLLFERLGAGAFEVEEPREGEAFHASRTAAGPPSGAQGPPSPSGNGRPRVRTEREPIAAAPSALRPDAIDGLDQELCARLRQHGIDSLESLARAEALELSQDLEIGLTRIMRWQFLARRHLQELGSARVLVPNPRPSPPSAGVTSAPAIPAAMPSTLASSASGPPAAPLRRDPELIRMPPRRAAPPDPGGSAGWLRFSHSERPPLERPADLSRELADRARRSIAPPSVRAELGTAGPLVL